MCDARLPFFHLLDVSEHPDMHSLSQELDGEKRDKVIITLN